MCIRDSLLAAPTGRAAKRMTEATGYEAKTIHRLLELTGMPEEDEKTLTMTVAAQEMTKTYSYSVRCTTGKLPVFSKFLSPLRFQIIRSWFWRCV